jgi:hypothetical protein
MPAQPQPGGQTWRRFFQRTQQQGPPPAMPAAPPDVAGAADALVVSNVIVLTDAAGAAEQPFASAPDIAGAADSISVAVSLALADVGAVEEPGGPFGQPLRESAAASEMLITPAVTKADAVGAVDALALTAQLQADSLAEIAGAADNLVIYPGFPVRQWSFEAGTEGWNATNSTIAQSTAWAAQGSHSLLVTATAGAAGAGFFNTGAPNAPGVPVTPATQITITADVRASQALSAMQISVNFITGVGGFVSNVKSTAIAMITGQVATLVLSSITVPATAATMNIFIQESAGDGTGTAFAVDNVVVYSPVPAARVFALPARPAFIRSQMPRMHIENLITNQWVHRDVQGVTSPSIIWQLNNPDTFTCTLSPPRPDLMSGGNPITQEWVHACYLEENDEIKFGGILTASTMQGNAYNTTWTGFAGYPNGIPYEGQTFSLSGIDGIDAVRLLWLLLQLQPGSNIGMQLQQNVFSGVQLGVQTQPPNAVTQLTAPASAGQTWIYVANNSNFVVKELIAIGGLPLGGGGENKRIKYLGARNQRLPRGNPDTGNGFLVLLTQGLANGYAAGEYVTQVVPPTPWQLAWWNSSDIGQEISSIQAECVFDWQERHFWTDPGKTDASHHLFFGVPRIGQRRTELRFAEGENIVLGAQVSRDGSTFANEMIGLGAGAGSGQIRSTVASVDGRLRRVQIYNNQTVKTQARMTVLARRQLAHVQNIDTPNQITVMNHKSAPFGSFGPGDDILVRLNSGWRKAQIWCRITQMQQDPTTNLMTLTLARSDSFTYMAQSGQAGTI